MLYIVRHVQKFIFIKFGFYCSLIIIYIKVLVKLSSESDWLLTNEIGDDLTVTGCHWESWAKWTDSCLSGILIEKNSKHARKCVLCSSKITLNLRQALRSKDGSWDLFDFSGKKWAWKAVKERDYSEIISGSSYTIYR